MSLRYRGGYISAEQVEEYGILNQTQRDTIGLPIAGQVEYTVAGQYAYVVPENVTEISAVVVGGGGGGQGFPTQAAGGGGGGLAWRNNIPVIPGSTINVSVGTGGAGGFNPTLIANVGGNSFIQLFSSNASVNIASQDNNAFGITFSTDGSKMFVVGQTLDVINQYILSESWNVQTAVYTSNINVFTTSAESLPKAVHFSDDGKAMYVSGLSTSKIIQYSLGTAFDINTASVLRYSSLLANTIGASGFTFDEKGENLYTVQGPRNGTIEQYKLIPAINVATQIATNEVRGFTFKSDGTKLYVPLTTRNVAQYALSEAWNISTASIETNATLNLTPQNFSANSIVFKTDGTSVYLLSNPSATANTQIYQYNLSTAWNIGTSTLFASKALDSNVFGTGLHLQIYSDGTKAYVSHNAANSTVEYTMSEAWNIRTLAISTANAAYNVDRLMYSGQFFSVAGQEIVPTGVFFKPDGTQMYIIGSNGQDINQYTLPNPWEIGSGSGITANTVSNTFTVMGHAETSPQDLYIKPDGTTVYVVGNTLDRVYPYTMTETWNINSLVAQSIDNSLSVLSFDTNMNGLFFKPDGTRLFVIGGADRVYSWNLGTAWNVATANITSTANLSVTGQELQAQSVTFSDDGTKMFVLGQQGDDINQYNLTDPWNINTATFATSSNTSAPLVFDGTPNGLYWKDGYTVYIVGSSLDQVRRYSLANKIPYHSAGKIYDGIAFNSDFTRFYHTSPLGNTIYQLSLDQAGNLQSQSSNTGGSGKFNGSTSYLTAGTNADWKFLSDGTSDWTIDFMMHPFSTSAFGLVGTNVYSQGGSYGMFVSTNINAAGSSAPNTVLFSLLRGVDGERFDVISTANTVSNRWNHIAVTFNSTSKTGNIFINGANSASFNASAWSFASNNPGNPLNIGRTPPDFDGSPGAVRYYDGYISNLRISNNVRGTTSVTVPTAPYERDANTVFLTLKDPNVFSDNSNNNYTITQVGGVEESRFAPFSNPALSSTSYPLWFSNVGNYNSQLGQVALSSDGKKLYFSSTREKIIYQVELSSKDDLNSVYYSSNPWNVTGLYPSQNLRTTSISINDIAVKPDGKAFTIADDSNNAIFTLFTNSAYNVSSAYYNTGNTVLGISSGSLTGFTFADRGRRAYIKAGSAVGNNDTVFSYDIKSPHLFYEIVGVGGGGGWDGSNFGSTGYVNAPGPYVGEGGGAGGQGNNGNPGGGGGGAGGYSGDGSTNVPSNVPGVLLFNGGGGNGSPGGGTLGVGGGGVGLKGSPFPMITNISHGPAVGAWGPGGSGGTPAGNTAAAPGTSDLYAPAGIFGGGGGGTTNVPGFAGGRGGVRIIWGTGRAYPNTKTQDV